MLEAFRTILDQVGLIEVAGMRPGTRRMGTPAGTGDPVPAAGGNGATGAGEAQPSADGPETPARTAALEFTFSERTHRVDGSPERSAKAFQVTLQVTRAGTFFVGSLTNEADRAGALVRAAPRTERGPPSGAPTRAHARGVPSRPWSVVRDRHRDGHRDGGVVEGDPRPGTGLPTIHAR